MSFEWRMCLENQQILCERLTRFKREIQFGIKFARFSISIDFYIKTTHLFEL